MFSIKNTPNSVAIDDTESISKADGLIHNGQLPENDYPEESGQLNSTGSIHSGANATHAIVATAIPNAGCTGPLTINSTFCGMGGIDEGFRQAGFQIAYANEYDSFPAMVYDFNYEVPVDVGDIRGVKPENLPRADGIVGGPPCQAYSFAGLRQGFSDAKGRGLLVFEPLRLAEYLQPKFIFFENVKGLVTHDKGRTFATILEAYASLGYKVKYKVLNAKDYGNVPQNRERIYVVAFLDEKHYNRFEFPNPIPLTTKLADVIDFEGLLNDKYYYTLGKHSEMYRKLVDTIDDPNTVYQMRRVYVRKNKSGLIPTLTANMGTGGNNVPIVKTKYGIRKLTPRECLNAQGFPKDFVLPEGLSDSRLYKIAGNSVCVPVVRRIAENIAKAIIP